MSRFFTHYWSNPTWNSYRTEGQQHRLLDQIASNQFRRRNIASTDKVYVVSVFQGTLFLLGALRVGTVCDTTEAAEVLGCRPGDLWDAKDQILASSGTPMDFDRSIPQFVANDLRFVVPGGSLQPPAFRNGILDSQTLRGVRELSADSAVLLDRYLPPLEPISPKRPWSALAEEVTSENTYFEGAVRKVFVNAYERDPNARQACIAHYGTSCVVCGFNFGSVYGRTGLDYIHVHHLIQLSSICSSHEVDPVTDMRPVCANCHAMLHRRTPPFSIEELQSVVQPAILLSELEYADDVFDELL